MAYIDVAKQETSDEILGKIGSAEDAGTLLGNSNALVEHMGYSYTDMELIELSKNYYTATFDNLADTETEVLNVVGEGVLTYASVSGKASADVTALTRAKIYIDDELFLNFAISVTSTSSKYSKILVFGFISDADRAVKKVDNLTSFLNMVESSSRTVYLYSLPSFKKSLKVVASTSISDANNSVNIYYALKE